MAHRKFMRDIIFGTYRFWHGLNRIVDSIRLDVKETFGWEVESAPLFFADGKPVEVPDCKGMEEAGNIGSQEVGRLFPQYFLRASDDGLAIGNRSFNPVTYSVLSNTDWFAFIQRSISTLSGKVNSLGTIRNRGRAFCSIGVPEAGKLIVGKHEHLTKLTFIRALDMSCKLDVTLTNFDTVCDNTTEMTLAFRSPLKAQAKMTKNVLERIANIEQVIDQTIGLAAQFRTSLERFANEPCDVEKAGAITAGFEASTFKTGRNGLVLVETSKDISTRLVNRVERVKELHVNAIGNNPKELTLHSLNAAMTQYYGREAQGGTDAWKAIESNEVGSARQAKADFFALLDNRELREETAGRGEVLLKEYALKN